MLSLLILLSLSGCGQKQAVDTNMTPNEIAESIVRSQTELPELIQITSADADFSTWVSDYYQLPTEQVENGVIFYADGVEASEIAVLVLADEKNAEAIEETLSKYIENRAGVFEGYAPQQAALAKGGIVSVNGKYVALLICKDTSAAKAAFLNCFEENNSISSQAETISKSDSQKSESESFDTENNSYDSSAVLQAWKSGDDSTLSDRNRQILNAAKEVLVSEIKDGMNDYEKELTIHDFITGHSGFSMDAFSRSTDNRKESDTDTPYGVLIGGRGNCWGYSSTFQLFMDMLDIECITVYGNPNNSGVEHAWNQVKLDGEWYCVDCAWDDPIGGSPCHTYFNVTSDYLRNGSIHRWDESTVPEATGTVWAYGKH
jgi:conserved domain protein